MHACDARALSLSKCPSLMVVTLYFTATYEKGRWTCNMSLALGIFQVHPFLDGVRAVDLPIPMFTPLIHRLKCLTPSFSFIIDPPFPSTHTEGFKRVLLTPHHSTSAAVIQPYYALTMSSTNDSGNEIVDPSKPDISAKKGEYLRITE